MQHDWSALWGRAGFVFWGGFIGSVIGCWIVIKRKKLSFPRFADVGGIAIAAGYAVGRTGCWAVGDDYGKPWNGPLAVMFPEGAPPSTAGDHEPRLRHADSRGVDAGHRAGRPSRRSSTRRRSAS